MTPKLEKIWVCPSCHYEFEGKITGKHWPYPNKDPETGYSCTGIVSQYLSQSSLVDLLKGRIEMAKNSPMLCDSSSIEELQSLLSMIEKGE